MKKIKLLLFAILIFIISETVHAGSASISANHTTVTVGSNVKITVTTKKLWGTYSISSSNSSILVGGDQGDISSDSFSKTFYFTAKKVGKATITFGPNATNNLADPDTGEFFNKYRTVTINVVEKSNKPSVDVNKTYSKNNYLKSLSIDGYELTPKFDKDTLEYTVTLEPGTEMIKISAKTEDDEASIKGIGDIEVSEGINTINVVVTAENGNERTYKILASVEEKDPIEVMVDNKKYRIVKKKNLLNRIDGYEDTTVLISGFDIPALYNDVTLITLVGLKDNTGNIELFSYDTKTGEFTKYNEFKFDEMNLCIMPILNSEFKPIEIEINDKVVTAYKLKDINDYYLLYGINTITGYQGYYLYDKKENSIQRYDTPLLESFKKNKDKFLSLVLVLSCVCFLTMLFLLIEVNRDNKRGEC